MPEFVHIFRLDTAADRSVRTAPQFQLTYNVGGKSYVRGFDAEGLHEFLVSDAGVSPEVADTAMEELHRLGKTTIAEVEIRETEAAAMGMEQVPSD